MDTLKIIKQFEDNNHLYGLGDDGKIYIKRNFNSTSISGMDLYWQSLFIDVKISKQIVTNFEKLIPFI